jgi:hypothetical protein
MAAIGMVLILTYAISLEAGASILTGLEPEAAEYVRMLAQVLVNAEQEAL